MPLGVFWIGPVINLLAAVTKSHYMVCKSKPYSAISNIFKYKALFAREG